MRLALIFSAIFVGGVVTLLASVYLSALAYLERQGDEIVRGQAAMLALAPPAQLADRITLSLRGDRRGVTYYGLFDAQGRRIAGNVSLLPAGIASDGVPAPLASDGYQPGARALLRLLPDGRRLFVGYDAKTLTGLRAILMRALLWSGGAVLAVGLGIGLMFGLGPIRRLRAIAAAVEKVRGGALSVRLPRSRRGDELDMLVALVNDMMDEVERLLGEVKSVGDNLAHDLRTPLGHLRAHLHGAIEQLEAGKGEGGLQRMLASRAAADMLLARFQAIQRIAEIDARKRRAGIARIDLSALVEEFGELYDPVAEERGLHLQVAVAPGIDLDADRDLLAEALSNLLDNAMKFTPPGGSVRLVLKAGDGEVRLEVADDGPGIAAEDRGLVRERYGRSLRDRMVPGAGLGLAMVAAVARLHDLAFELDDAQPGLIARLRAREPVSGSGWSSPACRSQAHRS